MEKAKGKKLFYRPAGKRKGMYTPTQIICVSFVIVIALGTFLLSLPVASKHGRLDVLDAMFTATSATCVTGLIVRDTWTQFTYFGQAVILLLIQVGGLGLVTLTSFFALAMRRRMGFRDLRLLGESVSADGYAQAKDVLKIVVGLAGLFEGIGIVLLLFAFVPQFGLEGIWVSVFTAISAFCNAGFDLFGRFGQYSSLAPYVNNYYVQAVVMFMIISGGLGFMVWVEIGQYRKKHRLSLQAKALLLVLLAVFVLAADGVSRRGVQAVLLAGCCLGVVMNLGGYYGIEEADAVNESKKRNIYNSVPCRRSHNTAPARYVNYLSQKPSKRYRKAKPQRPPSELRNAYPEEHLGSRRNRQEYPHDRIHCEHLRKYLVDPRRGSAIPKPAEEQHRAYRVHRSPCKQQKIHVDLQPFDSAEPPVNSDYVTHAAYFRPARSVHVLVLVIRDKCSLSAVMLRYQIYLRILLAVHVIKRRRSFPSCLLERFAVPRESLGWFIGFARVCDLRGFRRLVSGRDPAVGAECSEVAYLPAAVVTFHGVSPFPIQLPYNIIAYEFKLGKYIRLFSCNVTDYS